MAGELYINNRLIDIDQSLPFPLTFNIADIRDVSARKGNKSKTITVPGTNANSAIFRSIFLLTYSDERTTTNSVILDFDPSIKATARYYNNGILEFNGIAQLQECKLKDGTWSFDLTLVSDTIDYISRMNKVKINELDFTEFNHALTKANQFETWNGFNQINGASTSIKTGTDWDGVGYYYGLIDYGYPRTASDKFDCDQIPPQVFVYTILKKLFEYAGITWSSNFLESQRFKKLLMAYFGGNFPTITPAQQTNDSVFSTEINNASGFIVNGSNQANDLTGGGLVSFTDANISDVVDVTVISDPISQTVTSTPFLINAGTTGMYTVEYKGNHQLEVKFDQTTTNTFRVRLNFFIFKNGTIIGTDVIYQDSIVSVIGYYSNTFTFNYTRQINCAINDQIRFGVTLVVEAGLSFGANNLTRTIELTSSGTVVNFLKTIQELVPGGTVAIGSFLPDMTGDVFLKGLITMFNLMVKPATDNPSVLEIEPLSEFYTSSQDALDWTQLVDYSQELNVQPTINYASKEYNFDFKQDADYWNTKYQNEFLDNYGEFQILSQSQYATQVTKMALPFSQKPLVEIHTSLIVPASYQVNFDANANGQVVPKKGSAFIVYVGEMRSASWKYHDEFNHQNNLTEYPYVGHLDDIDNPTSDLNFGVPQTVYYPATVYTNNNLIQYHNTFIQELVSRYGKLLTCYAKIDTSIINTLDFRNLININGVVYRLQKISDYDSTKERTTQIELLRLIQGEGTPREDEFVEEGSTPSPIITEVENNTIIREQ
jgi:hypothetical protein